MFVYKIDVLQELKEAGWNTNRMRQEKVLSQATIHQLREGTIVGIIALDRICELLDLQPGNIIRHVPDEK